MTPLRPAVTPAASSACSGPVAPSCTAETGSTRATCAPPAAGLAPGYEVLPHLAHVPETTWVLQRILGLRMKTYQRGWTLVFRKPGVPQ